jgi:hypothetical protein
VGIVLDEAEPAGGFHEAIETHYQSLDFAASKVGPKPCKRVSYRPISGRSDGMVLTLRKARGSAPRSYRKIWAPSSSLAQPQELAQGWHSKQERTSCRHILSSHPSAGPPVRWRVFCHRGRHVRRRVGTSSSCSGVIRAAVS